MNLYNWVFIVAIFNSLMAVINITRGNIVFTALSSSAAGIGFGVLVAYNVSEWKED